MTITSKDNDFLVEADGVTDSKEKLWSLQEQMSYVIDTCLDVDRPSFTSTLIDVAGGIRAVASIVSRNIRNIRRLYRKKVPSGQSIDDTNPGDTFSGVPRWQIMHIRSFGNCATFLAVTSQQNCALREAYVGRNLVTLVIYTLRDICQLSSNLKHNDIGDIVKGAFHQALNYIWQLIGLGSTDGLVTVLCEALRAGLFLTILQSRAHTCIHGTDSDEGSIYSFLITFFRTYLTFDKVLRIATIKLEAEEQWLDAIAECDLDLQHAWNLFKKRVRCYMDYRSQIPEASFFFDQCAAVHVRDSWYFSEAVAN